jgi:3-oxoacyl-[acyl-carrier-protein] synthase-3
MSIGTKIIGVGSYVPERLVSNDDALAMLREQSRPFLSPADLDTVLAKARYKIAKAGNATRYWCRDDEYGPEIARHAAQRALADAGLDARDLDLIIYTGMSKAFVEPATGHVLRQELRALNANVIDTQDACASFIKSLDIADSLIKTGKYRTILVAAGERTFDWADFACRTVDDLAWKFGSLTIGDAAGALIVQRTEDPLYAENPRHMRCFHRLADGEYEVCSIGLNYSFGERYRLRSHSSRLVRLGLQLVMEMLADILQQDEWRGIRYDNLFIHDIGRVIDDMVLPFVREAKVCVPEAYASYYPKYGNVASASLPLSLDLAKRRGALTRGNLAVFVCPAAGVQAGALVFVY